MPPNRANDAKGNRAHDDEGLRVRFERHGQQHVDGGKGDDEVEAQAHQRVLPLLLLAGEAVAQTETGILLHQRGQERRFEIAVDFVGIGDLVIYRGTHPHDALAIGALDGGRGVADGDGSHLGKGHLGTRRRAHAHRTHIAQVPALVFGVAHHHPHIVRAALESQRLVAVEALAHLAG